MARLRTANLAHIKACTATSISVWSCHLSANLPNELFTQPAAVIETSALSLRGSAPQLETKRCCPESPDLSVEIRTPFSFHVHCACVGDVQQLDHAGHLTRKGDDPSHTVRIDKKFILEFCIYLFYTDNLCLCNLVGLFYLKNLSLFVKTDFFTHKGAPPASVLFPYIFCLQVSCV